MSKNINPLAVLKPEKELHRYKLSTYLRREENAQEFHEYYDGSITKLSPANGPHNIISANIGIQEVWLIYPDWVLVEIRRSEVDDRSFIGKLK